MMGYGQDGIIQVREREREEEGEGKERRNSVV